MSFGTAGVNNLNNHQHMVVEASEHYEHALKNLSDFASGNALSIADLTVKTMDVQHASAKLDLSNNAVKSASNMANTRARF